MNYVVYCKYTSYIDSNNKGLKIKRCKIKTGLVYEVYQKTEVFSSRL